MASGKWLVARRWGLRNNLRVVAKWERELIFTDFLPVSREDMLSRDWYYYDFLLVTGDAYVDHPSFGAAVIGRVLENEGYRVAVLAQPPFRNASPFAAMGRPRYAALVTSGNLDSMVAHYTAAKKPRSEDMYSPGKKAGLRPDRAVITYSKRLREAFPGLPLIIGGLEASLRRFAHYDYWDDKVRRPILFDADADFLVYGMGETAIAELAGRLAKRENVSIITDIRGTAFIASDDSVCAFPLEQCDSFETVAADKKAYARSAMIQYQEHDPVRGRAVTQPCDGRMLIVNPPSRTLETAEIDKIYDLPFTREVHPIYEKAGGVPAIDEVKFSIIHNRGCFGGCNFCSLAFHQGRIVASRSHESVVREAGCFVRNPEFRGYIHDVGGPTANFRRPSCKKQM
ncbi:MAG: YgiQ family radical SAM protein, partial [Oscillospiraceae bacterium]|nr:YgiQ family radical SAM protein [Oscillospiraceae bacterium]